MGILGTSSQMDSIHIFQLFSYKGWICAVELIV